MQVVNVQWCPDHVLLIDAGVKR